jgi:hypothetical protein
MAVVAQVAVAVTVGEVTTSREEDSALREEGNGGGKMT